MSELKLLSPPEPRNIIGDWTIRLGVAFTFVVIGLDKFQSGGEWIDLFRRIGVGDWFRWFTGGVEILGGMLVLIPRAALAGFALLAITMLAAALLLTFRLGEPGSAILPFLFMSALIGAALWTRGNR